MTAFTLGCRRRERPDTSHSRIGNFHRRRARMQRRAAERASRSFEVDGMRGCHTCGTLTARIVEVPAFRRFLCIDCWPPV